MDIQEKEDFKKELVKEYVLVERNRWYYILSGIVAVIVVAFGLGLKSVFDYVGTAPAQSVQKHLEVILKEAESYRSQMLEGLPVGTIVAWYNKGKMPSGWVICDGNNDTPDLTNKFIMGTTTSGEIGAKGGKATHTHEAHFKGSRFEATNQGNNGTGATRHDDTQVEIVAAENIPPFVKLIYIMKQK